MKHYIFLFTLLVTANSLSFATHISGTIRDDRGNILAFASVIVKGTTIGTTANTEGRYFLNLREVVGHHRSHYQRGPCKTSVHYPNYPFFVDVKPVKSGLKFNMQDYYKATGQAKRKANNVDERKQLVFP